MKVFLIILAVFVGVLAIKNNVTYRNHKIIGDAIFRFRMDLIDHGQFDLLWTDPGCSRILPPEKLELIRPYIEIN